MNSFSDILSDYPLLSVAFFLQRSSNSGQYDLVERGLSRICLMFFAENVVLDAFGGLG